MVIVDSVKRFEAKAAVQGGKSGRRNFTKSDIFMFGVQSFTKVAAEGVFTTTLKLYGIVDETIRLMRDYGTSADHPRVTAFRPRRSSSHFHTSNSETF